MSEQETKVATTPASADAKETKDTKDSKVKVKKSKSKRKSVPEAHLYVHAGYNNTLVSVAEPNGNVITWATSGSCGFKGARKATPYAAQVAAETACEKAKAFGLERVHVFVTGAGPGREQALRGVINGGISIESISDRTGVAHNGCRKARTRRV